MCIVREVPPSPSPPPEPPQETPVVANHERKRKSREAEEAPEEVAPKAARTSQDQTHAERVASHYNTLEEKGLDERSKSRIFYMRNFHNWIKSMLLNEYLNKIKDGKKHNSPIRVMDMCCGKGGDLLKWRKGGIAHLICSDIAKVSVDQCRSRYNDMEQRGSRERLFSIEYVVADCSRDRLREKFKDPSQKLDLVSCQFAFHYSFESIEQADCMVHNAAESLNPGGFFIGTIPDANDLIARARKSETGSFGNEVFKVQFHCDTQKPPLFGAMYNFHLDGVVDCPEFLVHFPTLAKLAKKHGLKLVQKEKFYEYYEKIKSEGRTLMGNMKGLEAYPAGPGSSLVGTAKDDYLHAEGFIAATNKSCSSDEPVRIGTLSKSEWEASCTYLTV